MRSGNYQDNVTMPLLCEHDYDATAGNEADEIAADLDDNANAASGVLPTIERVNNTVDIIE